MNVLTMAVRCHFPFSFFFTSLQHSIDFPSPFFTSLHHFFYFSSQVFYFLSPFFYFPSDLFFTTLHSLFYFPSAYFSFPSPFFVLLFGISPLLCFYSPSVILNYPFEICLKETLKFCA